MKVYTEIGALKRELSVYRDQKKTIGFVPTMGSLHLGHLTLVEKMKKQYDRVVVSIFVNPKQFDQKDDLENYPRDSEKDFFLLKSKAVDCVFHPNANTLWPEDASTFVEVSGLSSILMGRLRPGHFNGVTTVVTKLFNIIQPNGACFGEKDFQQVAIIKKMVRDLNIPVSISVAPTYREENGLAYSSRNNLLTPKERKAASILYQSLKKADSLFKNGERDINQLKAAIKMIIKTEPLAKIESIEICDSNSLKLIETTIKQEVVILLSVYFNNVRLIDTYILEDAQ